ncbi:hypothetical protein HAX54_042276 [Datura stramonium]|uniref:Uncharacterized protein n=1 Tax=Datura stramonium TaxID=4076 RepID=A0ABS8W343_DATST|nr:hypothetical protein [Datura stramonium]
MKKWERTKQKQGQKSAPPHLRDQQAARSPCNARRGARRQHCCVTRGVGRLPTCSMKRTMRHLACVMACVARQACSNGQKSNPTSIRKRSYKSQIKSANEQKKA